MSEDLMGIPGWRGGDGNAAYLDKTLRFNTVELSLDESVGWRVIVLLWIRASVPSFVVWFFFAFLALLGGGSSEVFLLGAWSSFVVFWIVLLLTKASEPIAEWRVLLADRGNSAESTYSQVAGTLRERRFPIHTVYRRIRTGIGGEEVSNRLVLVDGTYKVYVSVFGYGTSLYLGWMMWRSRRGYELIKQFLVDVVGGILGRNDPELLMLRTERPRAMREAVHAACREGLVVAIEGRNVPGTYGFPHGLPPVESGGRFPAAPVPGRPWPTSARA